jgi:hypothetical protein
VLTAGVRRDSNRVPGRHRYKWDNNIKIDVREMLWGGMDWINLAKDRDQLRALMNAVINLRVP